MADIALCWCVPPFSTPTNVGTVIKRNTDSLFTFMVLLINVRPIFLRGFVTGAYFDSLVPFPLSSLVIWEIFLLFWITHCFALVNDSWQWLVKKLTKLWNCHFVQDLNKLYVSRAMFEGSSTGNGNGNKMNLRIEILESLLSSLGEGTNAKVNSLKQTIRRNKSDMADDAVRSLDLMRQVGLWLIATSW